MGGAQPFDCKAAVEINIARRAFAHAFGNMSIRRIEAQVNTANTASNSLLLALGFQHEGLLRQRWVDKGAARDVNFYGCLAVEWLRTTHTA